MTTTRNGIGWMIATIIADSGTFDLAHIDVVGDVVTAWRDYGGADEPTNVVAFRIIIG